MGQIYQYLPQELVTFLLVAVFSLLIGLSQRRISLKREGETTLFGTDRTFTFIGILGYLLYILEPEGFRLFIGGGVVLGVLLFVLILSFRYPLLSEKNAFLPDRLTWSNFGFLLHDGTALLYFICAAWMCGLLGGIFALLSAYLSLYERNRLFIICAPVIGVYFINNFLTDTLHLPDAANILAIFDAEQAIFEARWLNIAYAVVVALAAFLVIGALTEKKIEREIYGRKSDEGTGKFRAEHKKQAV